MDKIDIIDLCIAKMYNSSGITFCTMEYHHSNTILWMSTFMINDLLKIKFGPLQVQFLEFHIRLSHISCKLYSLYLISVNMTPKSKMGGICNPILRPLAFLFYRKGVQMRTILGLKRGRANACVCVYQFLTSNRHSPLDKVLRFGSTLFFWTTRIRFLPPPRHPRNVSIPSHHLSYP